MYYGAAKLQKKKKVIDVTCRIDDGSMISIVNRKCLLKNFEDAKAAKSVAKKPIKTTNLEYFMVA